MTPQELKSSLILALAYSLRMFGMFIILPIFAVYASNLADTPSEFQIGLALGIYGLTQALFQIPFGLASDRYGRKKNLFGAIHIYCRVGCCWPLEQYKFNNFGTCLTRSRSHFCGPCRLRS